MRISACLMARNEEDNILRALDSVKALVDEICVLDTGSDDDTWYLLKAFQGECIEAGEPHVILNQTQWQDDFSFHRNQSMEPATGDWVFLFDADEEIVPNIRPDQPAHGFGKSHIKKYLESLPENYNCVCFQIRDLHDNGARVHMVTNHGRMFRRGRVRYENIVHNQAIFEGPMALTDMLVINHYGYDLTPEKKLAKFRRTEPLLLRQWQEGVKSAPYYLAQLYFQHGRPDLAVRYAEQYVMESGHESHMLSVYHLLARAYMEIGDRDNSLRVLMRATEILPDDPDIAYDLSDWGQWTKRWDICSAFSKRFVQIYEAHLQSPYVHKSGTLFTFTLTEDRYVICLHRACMLSFQEAMEYLTALAEHLPKMPAPNHASIYREARANMDKWGFGHLAGRLRPKRHLEVVSGQRLAGRR